MKVYVRKEDCQSFIPALFLTFLFFAISIFVFISMLSADSFMEGLSKVGIAFPFAILFFCFASFFLYSFIKKPKKYTAKLVSKKKDTYKGENITCMVFQVFKKKEREDDFISNEYRCFTYDDNPFVVNQNYNIFIKEFNWQIKRVESREDNDIISVPNSSMWLVFLSIGFIIVFNLLLGILGLMYYKEYSIYYILWILFFGFFFFYFLFYIIRYEKDNKGENDDADSVLQKYSILTGDKKISSHIIVRDLFCYLFVFLILCFGIFYILSDFVFHNIVYILIPIFFFIGVFLIQMLYYISYDNRLMKKYGFSNTTLSNIQDVSHFYIRRPTKNIRFEKYFIFGAENHDFFYNVQKVGLFQKKYFVYTMDGTMVAEIIRKVMSFSIFFIVRPVSIPPYSVRLKLGFKHDYEIYGQSYQVKGNSDGTSNAIINNHDEVVATIEAKKVKENWRELGNTEVFLYTFDINLILIALCVTMGNFSSVSRKFNK